MPWGLKRFQEARCLHFITFSCYQRAPLLASPEARPRFRAKPGARAAVVWNLRGWLRGHAGACPLAGQRA